ncbi:MAG: hypothetical protein WC510_06900 [Candidatus Omnitrophota bacterium]
MAKCPKCRKDISPYEFFCNGGWSFIRCTQCNSKLLVKDRDFYAWFLSFFILLFIGGIILIKYFNFRPNLIGSLTIMATLCCYFSLGWRFTTLEKK